MGFLGHPAVFRIQMVEAFSHRARRVLLARNLECLLFSLLLADFATNTRSSSYILLEHLLKGRRRWRHQHVHWVA